MLLHYVLCVILKLLVSELPDSSIPKFHTLTGKALKAINLKKHYFSSLSKIIQNDSKIILVNHTAKQIVPVGLRITNN